MATKETIIIPEEKIIRIVFDLAVRLRSTDNLYLPQIVLSVLENIKDPDISFKDLEPAQQIIVLNFIIEMLPQLDTSTYQTE